MKKTAILLAVGMSLVLILTVPFHSSDAQEKVIKLSFSFYMPPVHRMSLTLEEFCKEIGKRTNGRVDIAFYAGGSLLAPHMTHDGILKGIVDMGCSHVAYTRGRFPESEIFTTPIGFPDSWVAAQVANEFYTKYHPKEWDTIHPLFFFSAGGDAMMTKNKPIRRLEDLKGTTLRDVGRAAQITTALGATPRDLPIGETYDAISKGVVDGTVVSMEGAKGFKFADICKYLTSVWATSSNLIFYVAMNKTKWDGLPADVQKIFGEVAEKYKDKAALVWNEAGVEGKEYFLSKKGNEFIELSKDEQARWVKAARPVIEEYIKEVTATGIKEDKLREYVEFLSKRREYWTEREKQLKIPSPTIR